MGGDLTPPRLLAAYRAGIFPWYEPDYPILWWSPNPRLILYPSQFKISRSLQQRLKHDYQFTIDTAFDDVVRSCATVQDRTYKTWITSEMREAYFLLHELGYAHSFEIWQGESLIGGLYGLSLGKVFFGESMFHREKDASKMAIYFLCQTLQAWQFDFIDCQLPTKHLQSLGAEIINRHEFLKKLKKGLKHADKIGKWSN